MNIDRELMSLLEDYIYQEGLFKKFKDKKAARKREGAIKARSELRNELKNLPNEYKRALEHAAHCLREEYSFEGVYELMVEILFKAQAAVNVARILEPEEVAGAKKALAMYEPTRKRIVQMVKQRASQPEDFPGRCEESMDLIEAASIPSVRRDCWEEVGYEQNSIEGIVESYNKVMAEKQHPTDN